MPAMPKVVEDHGSVIEWVLITFNLLGLIMGAIQTYMDTISNSPFEAFMIYLILLQNSYVEDVNTDESHTQTRISKLNHPKIPRTNDRLLKLLQLHPQIWAGRHCL